MQPIFRLPVNNLQSVQLTVRVDCAAQCAFAPTKIRVFCCFQDSVCSAKKILCTHGDARSSRSGILGSAFGEHDWWRRTAYQSPPTRVRRPKSNEVSKGFHQLGILRERRACVCVRFNVFSDLSFVIGNMVSVRVSLKVS